MFLPQKNDSIENNDKCLVGTYEVHRRLVLIMNIYLFYFCDLIYYFLTPLFSKLCLDL